MGLSLQDDVLLISSNDPANRNFGTGFAVHHDHKYTYIITCAHVIRDVGGAGQVQVADTAAEVVALGSEDGIEGIDLAVVRVPNQDLIKKLNHTIAVLSLHTHALKSSPFKTAGFKSYIPKKSYVARPLSGRLGESINVGTSQSTLTQAWDLLIDGDFPLEPGYSGSPVVDARHHAVIGVAATIQDGGKKGVAISIAALAKIWPDMPATLLHPPRDPLTELTLLLQQANIARATVKAAYDRCVPEDLTGLNVWSFPDVDEHGLLMTRVVEQLDEVVEKEQGIPPLLAFAIHLSQALPADEQTVQDQFQRWIATYIETMRVDPQRVTAFQAQARMAVSIENRIALDPLQTVCSTPEQLHPARNTTPSITQTMPVQEHISSSLHGYRQSLLVRLKRNLQSNKSYFVQAWLRDNETMEHRPLPLTEGLDQSLFDKDYPVSRLPGLLAKFLADIAEYDDLEGREVRQPDIELF
ncbi:MAG TPA: serine protease, partial [Ktedonobacteraceae bacterium]|nr:serine protease [Ktedonobacteraceae bacterium]